MCASVMRDSDTAGRELAREARQQSRSQPFLRDPRPKRNRRSVDRAEKRLRMRHLRPSQRDQSAGKSRLKQQILNVKSITEW